MDTLTAEDVLSQLAKEYLLDQYCRQSGQVVNMADFTGGHISDTPVNVTTLTSEKDEFVYEGNIFYRDENLKTQQIDIFISGKQYTAYVSAKTKLINMMNRNPMIDDCVKFLSQKYGHIRTWAIKHDVLEIVTHEGIMPAKVTLIGYKSGTHNIEEVPFIVTEEHRLEAEEILAKGSGVIAKNVMSQSGVTNLPKMIGSVMPKQKDCKLAVKKIPHLLLPSSYGTDRKTGPTYAFQCKCGDSFLCPTISDLINETGDSLRWYGDAPKTTSFYLTVPVLRHVLYTFLVDPIETEDWEGKKHKKLIVHGFISGETMFYDAPNIKISTRPQQRSTIMLDQVRAVEDFSARLADKWKTPLIEFVRGVTDVPCRAKNHNPFVARKLRSFLTDTSGGFSFSATALTLELYDLCYNCYRASTAAFSMVPDDLF